MSEAGGERPPRAGSDRQFVGASAYHIEQLAAFCRAYPIERKILMSPSRQIGYNLLASFARSGHNWLNLEPLSPVDLAEEEVGPHLKGSGKRPIHTDTAHLIVADLLREIKQRRGNYFEPVAVTPSLARSVWDTLRSMRLAGVSSDWLRGRKIPIAKRDALGHLLEGFERTLQARGYYDDAEMLKVAAETATTDPSPVAILEELRFTRLEFEYVKSRFRDQVTVIGRGGYGITAPSRSATVLFEFESTEVDGVGPGGLLKSGGLSPAHGDRVQVSGAHGPEDEITDAVRFALKNDIPLDDIEIAYSRSTVHLPLLVNVGERFDLPITFGEGIPVNLTRPGRALAGILQWMVEDYQVDILAGLIQSGLLGFQRAVGEAAPRDNLDLASALLECPIGEGRDRYERGVEILRSQVESDAETGWRVSEKRLRIAELLVESVSALFDSLPADPTTSLGELATFCVQFLTTFAEVHGERDKRAQESLTDRIRQLADEGAKEVGLRFGCQLLIDMVDRHKVQAAIARPGALHAVPIARAGYAGRTHLFVVGLDVDDFPGRVNEDPILLDFERELVSTDLGMKGRQAIDAVWDLLRALGMSTGNVYLSSSVYNAEREEVVVYPSPFFQQAATDLGFDYENPPALDVRDMPLTRTEALLPQRRRGDFRTTCGTLFPALSAGAEAIRQRRDGRFSRFDGWVGDLAGVFEISDDHPVFSARKLEDLAACPHRYFLNDILYARKPRYYEFDTSRWLSAMDYGRLLHDLYERFLTRLSENDDWPVSDRHWPELKADLDRLIEEYRAVFPVDNQSAYEFECKRLELSAAAFLKTESEDPESRPLHFEVSFGMQSAEWEALREPVLLQLGDQLRFALRGRVDRIDKTPDGLVVWDYKSGGSWQYRQDGLIRSGLNLQWVLYAHALNQVADEVGLPGRIVRSGYYFANDRENGRRLAEQVPDPAETGDLLAPLFAMAREGAFLHVHKAKNECTFCDFKSVCASEKKLFDDVAWMENIGFPGIDQVNQWMLTAEEEDE